MGSPADGSGNAPSGGVCAFAVWPLCRGDARAIAQHERPFARQPNAAVHASRCKEIRGRCTFFSAKASTAWPGRTMCSQRQSAAKKVCSYHRWLSPSHTSTDKTCVVRIGLRQRASTKHELEPAAALS